MEQAPRPALSARLRLQAHRHRRLLVEQHDRDALVGGEVGIVGKERVGVGAAGDAFDAVLRKGLERDVSKRFQTAREMATSLAKVLELADAPEVSEWLEGVAHTALVERAISLWQSSGVTAACSSWAAAAKPR